jgi:hypothetical protein
VAVANAAEGELRGVETQRALPRHGVGYSQEEGIVHGVDNLGLPYAAVAAHAVAEAEASDAVPLLHDDPDPLVAEHGTVSIPGVAGRILAGEEETPVFVEEVGDEGIFPAEDAHFGTMLRGCVLDPGPDLVAADLGFLVVD